MTVLAARETCPRPWADPIGGPVAQQLALHGDRVALVAGSHVVSYRDLADRVATRATELGVHRRLVLVAAANDVETVVTYLAALSSGHPVLLVPRDDRAAFTSLVDGYDPDVIAGGQTRSRRHQGQRDADPARGRERATRDLSYVIPRR